jgi:hypothetical protein
MKKYADFWNLVRYLKTDLPFPFAIQVKRTRVPRGFDGDCQLKTNKFIIRIEKNLPEVYAMEVLLHEVGHALSWNVEADAHGSQWGKAYSLVYRKFLEWHEEGCNYVEN